MKWNDHRCDYLAHPRLVFHFPDNGTYLIIINHHFIWDLDDRLVAGSDPLREWTIIYRASNDAYTIEKKKRREETPNEPVVSPVGRGAGPHLLVSPLIIPIHGYLEIQLFRFEGHEPSLRHHDPSDINSSVLLRADLLLCMKYNSIYDIFYDRRTGPLVKSGVDN
ncbi:hypothetical protein SCLCIDRAFT_434531 [Scleroderma citrinum Foug A]|uniref:Uncharacterized protein n=1 Tax=Scleroderma citrinum Foug A TaxID=1036808 RepID=A0A0C2ZLJ5_9AGAM|nr:hypothetical protein SCLCIDRAFT_434531 [Scleroderma citrinum Foug A]